MKEEIDSEIISPETIDSQDKTTGMKFGGVLELAPGQMVAERYKVIEEVGRGGMGVVYKVLQVALQREMALKTIDASEVQDATWRRFQQEAKATSLLDHPNLITVHDYGLLNQIHPYFVMDLIEGTTLAKLIDAGGPLKLQEALPLFIQVCFGLAYAHDLGIVHRDIKPSNIMLCKSTVGTGSTTVKIVDFGIAKLHLNEASETQGLTRTGEIFGSPLYMSPEQCLGMPVDHRSDIYAAGCVFFEALSGVPPFLGSSALATMMKHQSEKPPSLKEITLGKEFPPEIEKLISRMLTKDPKERYQTLKAVATDLSLFQQGMSAQAFSGISRSTSETKPERQISLLAALVAATLSTVLGSAATWSIKDNIDKETYKLKAESQQKVQEPALPFVADENPADKGFSTFAKDPQGVLSRRFEFPRGFGKIGVVGEAQEYPASGVLYFPLDKKIRIEIRDLVAVSSPNFFLRFNPDDFDMLTISSNFAITDATLEHLCHLKSLTYLFATSISITSQAIEQFNQMPNLKRLYISNTEIRQDSLLKLKHLHEYTELGIGDLGRVDKVLKKLANSKVLVVLSVDHADLTDDDLKVIGTMTELTSLTMDNNPKVTNQGLRNLLPLKNLKWLRMAGTSITPAAISDLKKFPKLESITVFPDRFPDSVRARLEKELPTLKISVDQSLYERAHGKKNDLDIPLDTVKSIYGAHPVGHH